MLLLTWKDFSTPVKDSVFDSVTPRCMPHEPAVDVGRTEEHVVEHDRVDEVVDGSVEEDVVHGSGEEDVEHGTNDDDDDEDDHDLFVDEENEIVEPDVDAHLFDVVNLDGFDSDTGYDNETITYRRRRFNDVRREMEGVINATGQWKYSFYTRHKFGSSKEAMDRVYMHSIERKKRVEAV
ncbi:hypothetical protein Tco_0833180 [Tanacetum coccineum]